MGRLVAFKNLLESTVSSCLWTLEQIPSANSSGQNKYSLEMVQDGDCQETYTIFKALQDGQGGWTTIGA